jgi:hypothetical protein
MILKFKTSILITLSIQSSLAFGNPDLVCESLHKLSCAPGDYDDGTGVAKNPSYPNSERELLKKELIEKAKSKFKDVLIKPENSYFRKTVLSATGLSMNPLCDDANKIPTENCLNLMLVGVADITANKMLNPFENKINQDEKGNFQDEIYVTDSHVFKNVEDQLMTEMKKRIGIDEIDKKVKDKIFPQVKEILISKIELMIQNPELRKKMQEKIRDIEYDGSDCSKDMTGTENIPGILIPNAFYEPTKNIFKFCSGLNIQNKSDFQMAFVIAHELSHSIDPCGITMGPSDYSFRYPENISKSQANQIFPFSTLLPCLRSKNSVNAIDQLEFDQKKTETETKTEFKSFCGGDQIGESFSDWMASEITPDYIEKNYKALSTQQMRYGYSNIWRGMCGKENNTSSFDPHPLQERRTNYIILMQPKIRKQMGCPGQINGRVYCQVTVAYQNQINTQTDAGIVNKSEAIK